ncbi:MAG: glycosyltransferase family 39 protein [Acidobacteriota bacterium]
MNRRRDLSHLRIALVVLAAAALRIWFAATKSFSHPEMSVPLIPLPFSLADPGMRPTLYDTFVYNLMSDTHPPGYYLFEWFWMKLTGDSALAIRLPSALLGAASVWLLWLLARRCGWRSTALPAAVLLAFHGYHAAWSGFARMYAPACFLAVLSLWLLVRLLADDEPWIAWLYAAALAAGCATHVYFWAIAGAQVLYVLARAQTRSRAFSAQSAALTLASPLLALAAYQSFNHVATLGHVSFAYIAETFSFASLLPLDRFTDLFDPLALATLDPTIPVWRWLWWAACGTVAAIGILRMTRGSAEPEPAASPGNPPASSFPLWLAASCALLALAFIQVFITHVARPNPEAMGIVEHMRIVPFLLAGLAYAATRLPLHWTRPRWTSLAAAPFFTAAASLAMLFAASLVRPILTVRGLLPIAPFVLLVLAIGCEELLRRHRIALTWFLVVALAYGVSLRAFSTRLVDPQDFLAFTRALSPRLAPDDLIFFQRGWANTPVLFYLRPKTHHIYASDYCAALDAGPAARAWELRFYAQPNPPELTNCVAGLPIAERIEVGLAEAIRYERRPVSKTNQDQ